MNRLPMHPRALIRRAVCALLRGSGFPGQVYPSREEPWLAAELPSIGVYTVEERRLQSDLSPEPDERELTVAVDVLDRESGGDALDDRLDALTLYPEATLFFEAVRDAVAHAAAEAGFAPDDMPVLDFVPGSAVIGFAEDGRRVVACAGLSYTLTYRMPPIPVDADKLKTIVSGWDLADFPPPHGGPDGRLEAENVNRFTWDGEGNADNESETESGAQGALA